MIRFRYVERSTSVVRKISEQFLEFKVRKISKQAFEQLRSNHHCKLNLRSFLRLPSHIPLRHFGVCDLNCFELKERIYVAVVLAARDMRLHRLDQQPNWAEGGIRVGSGRRDR